MSLARRTEAIEPFLAVEVAERAQKLEEQGVDVVHLGYGEPDFAPPAVVQQALDRALADGKMRYTHSLGIPPLREAIADHYRATYGVKISPDQVLVTPGTSPAMMLLFGALLDPGDEVVLSDPYYACYPNFVRYADGVPAGPRGRAVDRGRRDLSRPHRRGPGPLHSRVHRPRLRAERLLQGLRHDGLAAGLADRAGQPRAYAAAALWQLLHLHQ
jgi:aminotransferase class I and II